MGAIPCLPVGLCRPEGYTPTHRVHDDATRDTFRGYTIERKFDPPKGWPPGMALSEDESAQLAALLARQAAGDDTPAVIVNVHADDDTGDDEPAPVEPEPADVLDAAVAQALVTQAVSEAEAAAQIAVIDAQTDAQIRLMEAAHALETPEPPSSPAPESVMAVEDQTADEPPSERHWWFRPLWGAR